MSRILYLSTRHFTMKDREDIIQLINQHHMNGSSVTFANVLDDVPFGIHFDAIITPTLSWLPQVLERLPTLPHLHFQSSGVERIWEMSFDKSRYVMTKSNGVHAVAMSEYAIGAMLYFAKSFDTFQVQARERRWQRFWLQSLRGKSVVILGMGMVGTALARSALHFGMDVIGLSRAPKDVHGVRSMTAVAEVLTVLPSVTYIVVSLPLTTDTRGLVDGSFLSHVQPGSVLIDISRGGVVVPDAVAEAVREGRLRGAALDVFPVEPLPSEASVWDMSNILVTPHVSGTTQDYVEGVIQSYAENARAIAVGRRPPGLVDVGLGY